MKPRRLHIVGNLAYVPLSQNEKAIIDLDDAASVGQYNWSLSNPHDTFKEAIRGVYNHNGKRTNQKMQDFILQTPEGMMVEHKDGNRLNNKKSNLVLIKKMTRHDRIKVNKNRASVASSSPFAQPSWALG
jgi:hypothetical protein